MEAVKTAKELFSWRHERETHPTEVCKVSGEQREWNSIQKHKGLQTVPVPLSVHCIRCKDIFVLFDLRQSHHIGPVWPGTL